MPKGWYQPASDSNPLAYAVSSAADGGAGPGCSWADDPAEVNGQHAASTPSQWAARSN